jgi:hypothetical protein
MMSELTLAAVLKTQERQKERIRQELISRSGSLGRELLRLAAKLTEHDNAAISSLGECQAAPHFIDRLCAVYMEKRDLIDELNAQG